MTVVHRIAGEELADRERFLTSKRATKPRCGNGVQQLGLKIIKVLGSGPTTESCCFKTSLENNT